MKNFSTLDYSDETTTCKLIDLKEQLDRLQNAATKFSKNVGLSFEALKNLDQIHVEKCILFKNRVFLFDNYLMNNAKNQKMATRKLNANKLHIKEANVSIEKANSQIIYLTDKKKKLDKQLNKFEKFATFFQSCLLHFTQQDIAQIVSRHESLVLLNEEIRQIIDENTCQLDRLKLLLREEVRRSFDQKLEYYEIKINTEHRLDCLRQFTISLRQSNSRELNIHIDKINLIQTLVSAIDNIYTLCKRFRIPAGQTAVLDCGQVSVFKKLKFIKEFIIFFSKIHQKQYK